MTRINRIGVVRPSGHSDALRASLEEIVTFKNRLHQFGVVDETRVALNFTVKFRPHHRLRPFHIIIRRERVASE